MILSRFHFQQHTAQGIAAAFVIGGEDRAADDFAKQAGGQLVKFFFFEGRDVGKFVRIFAGEFPFAAFAADQRALRIAFQMQFFVGAFAQNRAEAGDWQDGAAGGFDRDAGYGNANADFQVGGHERGYVGGDFQFDVLQNGLGAAGRGDAGRRLKCREKFFSFES